MSIERKTINCPEDRSCVVVLEPSGEEILLGKGQSLAISGVVEAGDTISIEQKDNCYIVHVPSGGVSLDIDGKSLESPSEPSLFEIIELEKAMQPASEEIIEFSDDFMACIQTLNDDLNKGFSTYDLPDGKLQLMEITAQAAMELVSEEKESKAYDARFVAAVCLRLLGLGAIVVIVPPQPFTQNLWSAAQDDLLGAEPRKIRRLLATSCRFPASMKEAVAEWSGQPVTE
jgi:hypothetical protein